jgi:diguanylate cyclase (GGDEF)-like protein
MVQRELTKEKKYELLNTYSPNMALLFSGLLSGISIILIIYLAIGTVAFFNHSIAKYLLHLNWLYLLLFFGMIGVVAARLTKLEFTSTTKVPYVYLFFALLIFIGIMLVIIEMFNSGKIQIFAEEVLKFRYIDFNFWAAISVTTVFCSLVFANPVKQTWNILYHLFLEHISVVDYCGMHNERYFYNRLREATYNARRYQINFSIILFKIADFPTLKTQLKKQLLFNVENDILHTLDKSVRETDIVGFLGEGEFYGLVLYTTLEFTKQVADRIQKTVNDDITSKYAKYNMEIAYTIWPFPSISDKSLDVEKMIKEIINPGKKDEVTIVKM